ncbi:hypothetical protein LXL04_023069 [Taraxacum kok-saghyz]
MHRRGAGFSAHRPLLDGDEKNRPEQQREDYDLDYSPGQIGMWDCSASSSMILPSGGKVFHLLNNLGLFKNLSMKESTLLIGGGLQVFPVWIPLVLLALYGGRTRVEAGLGLGASVVIVAVQKKKKQKTSPPIECIGRYLQHKKSCTRAVSLYPSSLNERYIKDRRRFP